MGWWLFNGVEIRLALGEVEEAMRDNEEAGRILNLLNDTVGMEQVTMNTGLIAQYQKSYEQSEKAFLSALKQAEKLGYPTMMVEVHVHLASLYADLGRREEAAREVSHVQELGEDKVYPALKQLYKGLKEEFGHKPG